jgi:hypothetical protein
MNDDPRGAEPNIEIVHIKRFIAELKSVVKPFFDYHSLQTNSENPRVNPLLPSILLMLNRMENSNLIQEIEEFISYLKLLDNYFKKFPIIDPEKVLIPQLIARIRQTIQVIIEMLETRKRFTLTSNSRDPVQYENGDPKSVGEPVGGRRRSKRRRYRRRNTRSKRNRK